MRSLSKWADRIRSVPEAPVQVAHAFAEMQSGRVRPVALECPMDILAKRGAARLPVEPLAVWRPPVDDEKIAEAAALLAVRQATGTLHRRRRDGRRRGDSRRWRKRCRRRSFRPTMRARRGQRPPLSEPHHDVGLRLLGGGGRGIGRGHATTTAPAELGLRRQAEDDPGGHRPGGVRAHRAAGGGHPRRRKRGCRRADSRGREACAEPGVAPRGDVGDEGAGGGDVCPVAAADGIRERHP